LETRNEYFLLRRPAAVMPRLHKVTAQRRRRNFPQRIRRCNNMLYAIFQISSAVEKAINMNQPARVASTWRSENFKIYGQFGGSDNHLRFLFLKVIRIKGIFIRWPDCLQAIEHWREYFSRLSNQRR